MKLSRGRIWFWWYHDTNWTGWKHFFLPWMGGDEFGRRTVVLPIHPFGWAIVALWTCYCEDCTEVREQTARWERENDVQEDR